MLQGVISTSCPSNIIPAVDFFKDNPGAYDLGELDQALFFLSGRRLLGPCTKTMLWRESITGNIEHVPFEANAL